MLLPGRLVLQVDLDRLIVGTDFVQGDRGTLGVRANASSVKD